MADFAALRTKMVDGQIRTSDVTDLRIIAAMLDTPREAFVSEQLRPLAYFDGDLPVTDAAAARVLISPSVLAKLVQAADVRPSDKVLEVGCASGYGAAILSRLARAVVALEEDGALVETARAKLSDRANVTVVSGRLAEGAASFGPFDAIVFNGSVDVFPAALGDQLSDGGRLAVVEGKGNAARAMLYRRARGGISGQMLFNAAVKPLPGFRKAEIFAF